MLPALQGSMIAAGRALLGLSQGALAELVASSPQAIVDLEAGATSADLKGRIVALFEQLGLTMNCTEEGEAALRLSADAPLLAATALAVCRADALAKQLGPSLRFIGHQEATRGAARQAARTAARVAVVKAFEVFRGARSDRAALDDFIALLKRQDGLRPCRRTLERWLGLYRREGAAGLVARWGGGPPASQRHLL